MFCSRHYSSYFHIIGSFINEIFQFVFLRMILWFENGILCFMLCYLCVHETCDNEHVKNLLKIIVIEFQFETIIYFFHIKVWV
jgi:hypothetical protein